MTKIKFNWIFFIIITSTVLLSLPNLFTDLKGDEITYNQISNNILTSKYFFKKKPSTVTPIIPLINSLFKFPPFFNISTIGNRLLNMIFAGLGLFFLYKTLKRNNLSTIIIHSILILCVTNNIFLAYFNTIYPESILFFSFWGIIYYLQEPKSVTNFVKILLLLVIATLTRYIYITLGLLVLLYFINLLKEQKKDRLKIIYSTMIFVIPLFFWAKHIYIVEHTLENNISYFSRYNVENPILYNIKCGIGLEKSFEVDKYNGIPAFISVFIPKTGIRNWTISIILILTCIIGYIRKEKNIDFSNISCNTLLIMLALILAGTGFSRYWIVLLPSFIIGFYLFTLKLKLNDKYFYYASLSISIIYLINQFRVDLLIIKNL